MLYEVKSKVLKFLSDIRLYPLGIVLYGQTGYKVKGDHTRQILNTIEPGDVLLTRYDHYLGYFVKGFTLVTIEWCICLVMVSNTKTS
jgi:hypothetical protein